MTSSRSSEARTEPGSGSGRGRKGRRILWVSAALLLLAAWDLSRPPERQWGSRAALAAIRTYQLELSHLRPGFGTCRFRPTCSNYARLAIARRGLLAGGAVSAWRVLRCGPWSERGTVDYPGLPRGELPPGEESVEEAGHEESG